MTSQKNNLSATSDSGSNTGAEDYHCSSDFSEIEEDSLTEQTTANDNESLNITGKDEIKQQASPDGQTLSNCLKGDICCTNQIDIEDGFVNVRYKSSSTEAFQDGKPPISMDDFPEDNGSEEHVFIKPIDTCSSPANYNSHTENVKDVCVKQFPIPLEKKSDSLRTSNSKPQTMDNDAGNSNGKRISLFFPDVSPDVDVDSVLNRKQTSAISDIDLSSDDGKDESVRESISVHNTNFNINRHLKGDHHLCCTDLSEVDDDFVTVLQKSRKRRAEVPKGGRSTTQMTDFLHSQVVNKKHVYVKNPDKYRYSHSDEDEDFSLNELLNSKMNSHGLLCDEAMKIDTCQKIQSLNRLAKTDHKSRSNISGAENDSAKEFHFLRQNQPPDFREVDSPVSGINKVNLSIYISIDDIDFSDREGLKNCEKNTGFSDMYYHCCCDKKQFLSELPKSENNIPVQFLGGESAMYSSNVQRQTSEYTSGRHDNKNKNLSDPEFSIVATEDAVKQNDLEETKHESFNVSDDLSKESSTGCPEKHHTPAPSIDTSTTFIRKCSRNVEASTKDFDKDLFHPSVKWVSEFPHNQEQTPSAFTFSVYPKLNEITSNENLLIKSKSPRPWSNKVKSKYLGTLALLDQNVSLENSEPLTANLLRAVYYHRWLTKKNEKSKENLLTKRDEEVRRQKENQAKQDAALLSYKAWEKKKKSLEAESKEKQEIMKEEQQTFSQQVAERRLSAEEAYKKWKRERDHQLKQLYKQKKDEEDIQKLKNLNEKLKKIQTGKKAFDKWKQDYDHLHKEKGRKKKEAEDNIQLIKQNEWLKRKEMNETIFNKWCEKKHASIECKNMKTNKQEEKDRLKEERDKVALKAYEDWLAKKDLK